MLLGLLNAFVPPHHAGIMKVMNLHVCKKLSKNSSHICVCLNFHAPWRGNTWFSGRKTEWEEEDRCCWHHYDFEIYNFGIYINKEWTTRKQRVYRAMHAALWSCISIQWCFELNTHVTMLYAYNDNANMLMISRYRIWN